MRDKEKVIRIVYYLVVAVLVIIASARIFSIEDTENVTADEWNLPSFGLYMAYAGMILAMLLWVANFVIKLFTDAKSQLGAIIGAVVVVAIFFIAKGTMPLHFVGMELADGTFVSEKDAAFSSAGLVTMYVVAGLAIFAAIGTGIKALFE